MEQVLILIHIILAVALVAIIMLQQGKGANIGAAFGSGASNTLFGSRGPASFLMKLTGGLMALFFVTSISLGYIAAHRAKSNNIAATVAQNEHNPVSTTQHHSIPAKGK